MAAISWCVMFPLISILLLVLMPLLAPLPFPLPAAVMVTVAVLLMTYLLMPNATRAFSGWLYPDLPAVVMDEEISAPQ